MQEKLENYLFFQGKIQKKRRTHKIIYFLCGESFVTFVTRQGLRQQGHLNQNLSQNLKDVLHHSSHVTMANVFNPLQNAMVRMTVGTGLMKKIVKVNLNIPKPYISMAFSVYINNFVSFPKSNCWIQKSVNLQYNTLGPNIMTQNANTVHSRFSDILFSDKPRFSDNFAEDRFFTT